MAETTIAHAPDDLKAIAQGLIDEHHEELINARILWLTTTAKRSSANRVILGTSARTTPLLRFLTIEHGTLGGAADFIVQIDEKRWKTMLATQKAALVDNCLCRMQWKETTNERTGNVTGRWITVGPDINEFSEVLERHGAWLPAQARMVKIVRSGKQLKLDEAALERGLSGEEAALGHGKPADRKTVVDGEGVVASTERLGDDQAEHDAKNRETAERLAASTNGHSDQDPGDGPDWRAGMGTSDLAQHRAKRRRGTASSEQPAAT